MITVKSLLNKKNILEILLTALIFNIAMISSVAAQPPEQIVLEIAGEGVSNPCQFTLSELQAMEQYQQVYSTINTWPTKRWYIAEGVKLRDLLKLVGIRENAKLIKFTSSDGYSITMTVKELLEDKRYLFPNFMDTGYDGSIAGSTEGAQEVEPMLALISSEGSRNPNDMNDMNSLLMICGQRAVTEQTNHLFLKHVSKIEVDTDEPLQWENPKAKIGDYLSLEEALLELSNKGNDVDKIYYTTDGSTPTINSPMFNWSAQRWQGQRGDDIQQINRALKINKDTVIKAITIGPGKRDSDVVTFTFSLDPDGKVVLANKIPTGITFDKNYLVLNIGETFQLGVTVNIENSPDSDLIWESSDTRIATVDNNGLITVVSEGTAIITAKEPISNFSATCTVIGTTKAKEVKDEELLLLKDSPPIVTDVTQLEEKALGEETINNDEEELGSDSKDTLISLQQLIEEKNHLHSVDRQSLTVKTEDNWQVYEVSLDSYTFKLDDYRSWENFILVISFSTFFLVGAGTRYRDFKKEGIR